MRNSEILFKEYEDNDGKVDVVIKGIRGKFKDITGIAVPCMNLGVKLFIGNDDGSDDCIISKEEFDENYTIVKVIVYD